MLELPREGNHMKRMRWLALLAIFAVFAVACSAAEEAAETATDAAGDVADAAEDAVDGDDDEEAMEDDEEEAMEDDEEGDAAGDAIAVDFGVNDETIRVGLSADLSGIFAGLTTPITDAQSVYFDILNENGGIAGRDVELVILDSGYDVPTHLDNYAELSEESDDGVVMISQSTGSPHTGAIAADLADDDLIAIPLSWYSGWADQDLGSNVFELYTNYCFEGMNGVEFLAEESAAANPTLAVVSLPGEYGQDGAAGAKIAAAELGLEIVYDGEAQLAGDDFSGVVSELVAADPDIVWITSSPGILAQVFGAAAAQGLDAIWSGNSPSYNPALLGTDVGPALSASYFHSTYTALWDSNDSSGMQTLVEAMTTQRPDATYALADAYIIGWTEAIFTQAVLEQAAANGDLTRAGVVAAANQVSVDFQGLAPDQTWVGDPNDFAVRGSFIYSVDSAAATLETAITQAGGAGFTTVRDNFAGSVAQGFEFNEPCFISAG